MKIKVYYEDTDLSGFVYHANYLKYCERARSELFFSQGLSPVSGEYHFVVRSMQIEFFAPAKLGDDLEVKTSLLSIQRASAEILQEIFRQDQKIFSARIRLACLKGERPSRIPESWQEVLSALSQVSG